MPKRLDRLITTLTPPPCPPMRVLVSYSFVAHDGGMPAEWKTLRDSDVPSLGTLQRANGGWVWAVCDWCQHRRPLALAAYVIRWGPNASSNRLRRALRCQCGRKGCSIQTPGWVNQEIGVKPFPDREPLPHDMSMKNAIGILTPSRISAMNKKFCRISY